jgi:GTP-binding protein
MLTLALVGRPNVGKSTLFNALTESPHALVYNKPGVTRDRQEALGHVGPLEFKLVDTPGWCDPTAGDDLEQRMQEQIKKALQEADICLLLTDVRGGITAVDLSLAQYLRNSSIPVILLLNKCEGMASYAGFEKEFYRLGFKTIVGISAAHREGFNSLYEALISQTTQREQNPKKIDADANSVKTLQLVVLGRPNVGKSTLINRLIGSERLITNPQAGTTRDSIRINWILHGRPVELVDTAGIRRHYKTGSPLEQMSVESASRALAQAHIAILLWDATTFPDTQDLALASNITREGKGLVLVANKWDKVENPSQRWEEIKKAIRLRLPTLAGIPLISLAAISGENLDKLMATVEDVFTSWNSRVSTSILNKWLRNLIEQRPPPLLKGSHITRLKYITQIKRHPPTFKLFTNNPERLNQTSYDKFLINRLRKDFDLTNTVVRLLLAKEENPFATEKY